MHGCTSDLLDSETDMMSREMAAGKVLLVGCMAALALASAHGTRVEKVVGRQHPDTHVDGFVLKSVFLHDTNSNTVSLT